MPYFGTVQPSAFFQRTAAFVAGVTRINPLAEGIYKPASAAYALSISSMLKSPYNDQLFYNADRTWWMNYSPKNAPMHHAVNASMIRCITDRQPVLVLKQLSDKTSAEGARHRLLGLGFVENFDPATNLFRIRGLEWSEVSATLGVGLTDDLLETALRLESLEEWTPFVAEDRFLYQVSRQREMLHFDRSFWGTTALPVPSLVNDFIRLDMSRLMARTLLVKTCAAPTIHVMGSRCRNRHTGHSTAESSQSLINTKLSLTQKLQAQASLDSQR